MPDFQDISTAPETGTYVVLGGHYNTAYGHIDGFSHDSETVVAFVVQSNPDVDPPYRVVDEPGLGIEGPTHWRHI
jgi:hypothetical protein